MKAVYFGAGIDTYPYKYFPNIKLWISSDSQPLSEFGSDIRDVYRRPEFISELDSNMLACNFRLIHVNGNIRKYYNINTDQRVIYHTNTPIPESLESKYTPIYRDTFNWDTIYVSGFTPTSCIIKTAKPATNLRLIGISSTCYRSFDEDTLITDLNNGASITKKISYFDYIDLDKHELYSYETFDKFIQNCIY